MADTSYGYVRARINGELIFMVDPYQREAWDIRDYEDLEPFVS